MYRRGFRSFRIGCSAVVFIIGRIPLIGTGLGVVGYMYFVLGMLWYKYSRLLKKIYHSTGMKLLSFALVCGILAIDSNLHISSYISGFIWVITVICIVYAWCNEQTSSYVTKGISIIGQHTLPLYAIHWCLLFSPIWRMKGYALLGIYPLIFRVLVTLLFWSVVCWGIIMLVRKHKWLRRICFGEY